MGQQDDLFQQLPLGIVPPKSVVDTVMSRIQHTLPQHPSNGSEITQATKSIAKVIQIAKSNLFILLSSSVIVGTGAITTVVMLHNAHPSTGHLTMPTPSELIATDDPSKSSGSPLNTDEFHLPIIKSSENPDEFNHSEVPLDSTSASGNESPEPSDTASPKVSNAPDPSASVSPSESSSPVPSSTPNPSVTPTSTPVISATTSINTNITNLVLGWKIPNLEDNKLIYIHKNSKNDSTLTIDILEMSYHPQDPNNVYMNGSGAAVRVLQFYNNQFVQIEININQQWIPIWIDLGLSQVQITGTN
jgi:hypothetical protein